ncbi:hypothetical protein [Isoptericola variabilis]|uniref:Uncharacterized protein n=1 Tax=Isoptericola variabilis (strain 225) TaxID=743718 RepID=F6FR19_ISOV2|nr:hypothetical protein [Isoptericola variabilis]AEG44969.1 hypothetical protein Isova_2249 [Isoptericola variabilis 225]
MLQRILGVVLVLLGLVGIALGVASATVWKDPDTVVATARPAGDGTMVVTDPGVLDLVDGDVTITATVPAEQTVTLAIGHDVDVLGWVGQDPYTRVTGLSDWETLATRAVAPEAEEPAEGEEAPAEEEPAAAPDPAGSDMWVQEATDTGSVTLRWSDRPGRWMLLAAGAGENAQAPTIELTWPRTVTTPYLWPGVGGGAFLVLAGLALLLTARRRSKLAAARSDSEGHAPEADERTPAWAPEALGSPADPAVTPDRAEATAEHADAEHADAEPASPAPAEAGTDPVPVVGRFARRSRRERRTATAAEPGTTETAANPAATEPAATGSWSAEPAPGAPAAEAPTGVFPPVAPHAFPAASSPAASSTVPEAPASQEPPTVTTGSLPVIDGRPMTRRELRELEQSRRAAEQGGVGRRLRALTGSIPVVRPHAPTPPPAPPVDGEAPAPQTRAGRAAAWRQAWGFTPGETTDTDTTDGGNR